MRLRTWLVSLHFLFFFISCQILQKQSELKTGIEEVGKYYLFSPPRRLSLETAPEEGGDFLKKEILLAKNRWNGWFKKEIFYIGKENLPKITIRNGDRTTHCSAESKLLAFAVPINDGDKILRGSIYVCLNSFKFAKRTRYKDLDLSFVITHEIGHFIFKQHFAQSNLMNESFKGVHLSEFDSKVLIPSLQKTTFQPSRRSFNED